VPIGVRRVAEVVEEFVEYEFLANESPFLGDRGGEVT
jgi:hypothetical protein